MFRLAAFCAGLLAGLALTRRPRSLLLERWRALQLLPLILVASLLPGVLARYRPELIWTADRGLLLTLMAFSYLLSLLLIGINCWPARSTGINQPGWQWYHRLALAATGIGLLAEAAVLMLNQGYMPIPESYLADLQNPVEVAGIYNQAFYLKRLIDSATRLPWLGQIWRADFLAACGLIPFPLISPAEVLTAAGLFLTGLSQFWGRIAHPAGHVVQPKISRLS
jgi:hypothetical protein